MTEATFIKNYKNRKGQEWTLSVYMPYEGHETIVLNNPASTKRKVYVEYPECYLEIQKPDGGINANHLENEDELRECLYRWSNIWGDDFWNELNSRYLI